MEPGASLVLVARYLNKPVSFDITKYLAEQENESMSLTEYDNTAKWASFFHSRSRGLKISVVVVAAVVAAIWGYSRFGPIRELKAENQSLKAKLDQAISERAAMMDRKNELYAETLYLKGILDPVQKKATLLYPELETAAAVARLAGDLQDVRALATRDVYKPLSDDFKKRLVEALRLLRSQAQSVCTNVTIKLQQGSSSRARVADDLKRYVDEAGYTTTLNTMMAFYSATPRQTSRSN